MGFVLPGAPGRGLARLHGEGVVTAPPAFPSYINISPVSISRGLFLSTLTAFQTYIQLCGIITGNGTSDSSLGELCLTGSNGGVCHPQPPPALCSSGNDVLCVLGPPPLREEGG